MDLGLRGRVAIVCASSDGLGKATAQSFVKEGTHVVVCGRDRRRLIAAAREIAMRGKGKSAEVMPVAADLSRAKDIRKLVSSAVKEFGRVDILVCNAGGPPVAPFAGLGDEQWQRGVDLTLFSAIRCIREALPHMQHRQWGRIITITSLTAKQPADDLVISSTIRPGILGLSKVLANQLATDGITVNCVAPGYFLTERQKEISASRARAKGVTEESYREEMAAGIPMKRYGRPAELADTIVFLASARAGYINGATISVDGGLIRGLF